MVLVIAILGALSIIALIGYLVLSGKILDKAKITKSKQDEFEIE